MLEKIALVSNHLKLMQILGGGQGGETRVRERLRIR